MCWKCRWQQIEACRVVVVEFSFFRSGIYHNNLHPESERLSEERINLVENSMACT